NETYYYNVTSCDYPGNCNTSGSYNFTTYTEMPVSVVINTSNWYLNETTNFSTYNETELQNMTNVTLSNQDGKIRFLETVNISQYINLTGKIVIGQRSIMINSTLLPEFNHSANLTFRSVTLSIPIIKRNGVDCSSAICQNISFNSSSGIFELAVTEFSTYTLVEQCSDGVQNYGETGVDCGGSCSACGGGGTTGSPGGSLPPVIVVPKEETEEENITITVNETVNETNDLNETVKITTPEFQQTAENLNPVEQFFMHLRETIIHVIRYYTLPAILIVVMLAVVTVWHKKRHDMWKQKLGMLFRNMSLSSICKMELLQV
ncbi:MAG: hypothetical protein KAS04_06965, partial [Candidatus Aenigmarchaeota archaeon]|nr:hypothetical protein [Candidatus Aenigmarchaeota archaeon]